MLRRQAVTRAAAATHGWRVALARAATLGWTRGWRVVLAHAAMPGRIRGPRVALARAAMPGWTRGWRVALACAAMPGRAGTPASIRDRTIAATLATRRIWTCG
jgi:hypothetical protein